MHTPISVQTANHRTSQASFQDPQSSMERKQEQEKSFEEEAAMAMEASSSALRLLLHRMAQRCAGYLGLAVPLASDYSQSLGAGGDHLKPTGAVDGVVPPPEEEFTVVQVQSRSMVFQNNRKIDQGVGGRGGIKY
ncbi:hypothetical protein VPH35_093509 [Triticum aestivum]